MRELKTEDDVRELIEDYEYEDVLIFSNPDYASAFIGIWSFKRASEIAKTITSENNLVANMRQWISENRENFCVSDTAGLSGSEIYFQRELDIRNAITAQFPEIDESLLEIFVEETYQFLFEQI